MMNRLAAAVTATLLAVPALAACGARDQDPEYVGVCTNPDTQERVDDDYCDPADDDYVAGMGYVWFYLLMSDNHRVPPVGGRYNPSYGKFKVPSGVAAAKGGLPKSGATSPKSAWSKSPSSSTYKPPSGSGGGAKAPSGSTGGYKAPAPAPRPPAPAPRVR